MSDDMTSVVRVGFVQTMRLSQSCELVFFTFARDMLETFVVEVEKMYSTSEKRERENGRCACTGSRQVGVCRFARQGVVWQR